MHEELIGYLLGALEPEEVRALEERLQTDAALRRKLRELRRLLQEGPGEGYEVADPPPNLAERTCDSVEIVRHAPPPLVPEIAPAESSGRWNKFDAVTLVGLAVAAVVMLMPLISMSRQRAQVAACRERMREVGRALIDYSRGHNGYFPEIPSHGALAHAGIYAMRLREAGYLPDRTALFCPAMLTAKAEAPVLPTMAQLTRAGDADVEATFAQLDGLYGYALGYVEQGRYHSPRNHDRLHYAVLADAPPDDDCRNGGHACGRNVWFEDGHAEFLNACRLHLGEDAIYENHHGFVGAGIGPDDVVIGSGAAMPRIVPVKFGK